ncbi:hypothetical protein Hypma_012991 [Hypsizygus marmoreus]|uniref:F-box domain-containing protein n=1 Tax=Hypsizygus marmoreus TaxID=39966 RepID=A0A369JLZ4_HYPMA|nr:hypothetical protein Hypma_012991 [Hypsizygus marmoreus]
MLRRSNRRITHVNTSTSDPGSGEDSESEATERKPRKARRTTSKSLPTQDEKIGPKRQLRGRRGVLKQLMELPMELLFEIFGHLGPADILYLSRTSKDLRSLLMRKPAEFIWKLAHANVGLPDCPPDLNEPQFAKLLFDPHCDYCGGSSAQTIVWASHTRVCKECLANPLKFGFGGARFSVPQDIIPMVTITARNGLSYRSVGYCYRSASQLDEYHDTLDVSTKLEWIKEKREEQQSRLEHTKLCQAWFQARAEDRAAELENVRKKRYSAIKAKLIELGWAAELEKMNEDILKDHKLVKQSKLLTNRIWDNIKLSVTRFMEHEKEKRLLDEYRALQQIRCHMLQDIYHDFIASQPIDAILPGIADIAVIPDYRSLIDSPVDQNMTPACFAAAAQEMPRFVQDWRHSVDTKLVALIKESGLDPHATEASLDLPTTFFKCDLCGDSIGYPRVLVHVCMTSLVCPPSHPDWYLFAGLKCQPWNECNLLFLNQRTYSAGMSLLRQCGLDPNTTTKQILEDPAFFIECSICSEGKPYERAVMAWHTAAHHIHVDKEPRMHHVRLSEEERATVAAYIRNKDQQCRETRDRSRFVCIQCKQRFDWSYLHTHFAGSHGNVAFAPLVESVDYVLDMDYDFFIRQNVHRIRIRPQ